MQVNRCSRMIQFISFGSGSSGNCYYINNEGAHEAIIVDVGIGIRRIKKYFREYNINISEIKGVLITHDHADHIKCVGNISEELNLPVYTTNAIHEGIDKNYATAKKIHESKRKIVNPGEVFCIGNFRITAFPIPHDSTENMGYEIHVSEGHTFTIMTDIGCPTEEVQAHAKRANHLVIEANYDEDMLMTGPYPRLLKERIRNGEGHLSNSQCASILSNNFHEELKNVWLCHLSKENNHPELARKTIEYALQKSGISVGFNCILEVLKREIPSGPWTL